MGFFDSKAADDAKAKRAAAPLFFPSGGRHLSFGGSGRDSTRPENQGLCSRAQLDAAQENAKSGWFGITRGRHVTTKAREAQRRARTGKSWWGK